MAAKAGSATKTPPPWLTYSWSVPPGVTRCGSGWIPRTRSRSPSRSTSPSSRSKVMPSPAGNSGSLVKTPAPSLRYRRSGGLTKSLKPPVVIRSASPSSSHVPVGQGQERVPRVSDRGAGDVLEGPLTVVLPLAHVVGRDQGQVDEAVAIDVHGRGLDRPQLVEAGRQARGGLVDEGPGGRRAGGLHLGGLDLGGDPLAVLGEEHRLHAQHQAGAARELPRVGGHHDAQLAGGVGHVGQDGGRREDAHHRDGGIGRHRRLEAELEQHQGHRSR